MLNGRSIFPQSVDFDSNGAMVVRGRHPNQKLQWGREEQLSMRQKELSGTGDPDAAITQTRLIT